MSNPASAFFRKPPAADIDDEKVEQVKPNRAQRRAWEQEQRRRQRRGQRAYNRGIRA